MGFNVTRYDKRGTMMLKSAVVVLALAAVGVVVSGCSSSSSSPTETDSGTKEDAKLGGDVDSGSTSGTFTTYSCNQESTQDGCTIFKVAASGESQVSQAEAQCKSMGGTVGTTCPTAKLVGCCTTPMEITGYGIICSYTGDNGDMGASGDESACKSAFMGTWSTSQ